MLLSRKPWSQFVMRADAVTPDLGEVAAHQALHALVAAYCEELDATAGLNATRYLTADCRMDVGNMQLHGHSQIEQFYRDFNEQVAKFGNSQPRTTRHLATNLRVRLGADGEAKVDVLVLNFSAMGRPPISSGTTPTVVSDMHLSCRQCGDGKWRISELTGGAVFVGDDPLQNKALIKE